MRVRVDICICMHVVPAFESMMKPDCELSQSGMLIKAPLSAEMLEKSYLMELNIC